MVPRPDSDLIVAAATPAGRGGIGVIRVSGPVGALEQLAKKITGRRPGEDLLARQAVLAAFQDENGDAIDVGLVLYFPAPKSFTGEHVLELQGHGSPVVINMLLARCVQLGARLARPGEFSERAFLNGRMDLTQAEAVADLIDASTQVAARSAMRSLSGEFSRQVGLLSAELVQLRTLTEATLDFPDEEVDFLVAARAFERLDTVDRQLQTLLVQSQRGSLLRTGLTVVLIGQPNVGKSSLLNCLAGEEVAIVTPVAGTTRDALKSQIQIHGIPLHIIDTAGLRDTQDSVERLGIERTWRELERADLAVLLVDAEHGMGAAEQEIIRKLPKKIRLLTVINKIDLLNQLPRREVLGEEVRIHLSARHRAGIDFLEAELLRIANWQEGEDVFIARERHLQALKSAQHFLTQARDQVEHLELFAEELRNAHRCLQEITGEYTPDDLLGKIFSTFCIGK